MGNCIIASPNQVKIITKTAGSGRNVILNAQCGWQWWFCNEVHDLPVELFTLIIHSNEAETVHGVKINVTGVCQIKVGLVKSDIRNKNFDAVNQAFQNFAGFSKAEIQDSLRKTMEGHQRQLLGTLSVEEVFQDRARFSDGVRTHVENDVRKMGFSIVSYTVTDISDNNGYMDALGQNQLSKVLRNAKEGESKNAAAATKSISICKAEADRVISEFERISLVAQNERRQQEAESMRDLYLKKEEYDQIVNKTKAEADVAYDVQFASMKQMIIKEETKQDVIKTEILVEVENIKAETEQEVRKGESLSELVKEKNEALGVEAIAQANAHKISWVGQAEADSQIAMGNAVGEILSDKAKAYQLMGQATVVETIVSKLPEVAANLTKPLTKADKLTIISSDSNSATKITSDVTQVIAQIPSVVQSLTGVNISKGLETGIERGA